MIKSPFLLNQRQALPSRYVNGQCVLSFNSDHPGASASFVPGCGKRFVGERAIQDQSCFTSLDHRPKAIKARSIRIYHWQVVRYIGIYKMHLFALHIYIYIYIYICAVVGTDWNHLEPATPSEYDLPSPVRLPRHGQLPLSAATCLHDLRRTSSHWVTGKDDNPFLLWKIKDLWNHQPDKLTKSIQKPPKSDETTWNNVNQRETGPVAANANMHHPFWRYLHGAAPTLSLLVWLNICDV